MIQDEKICSKCGRTLDISDFRKSKGKPVSYCKLCEKEYYKNWYKKYGSKHTTVKEEKQKSIPEGMQRCTKCKELKLPNEFSKGVLWCKKCVNKYYENNKPDNPLPLVNKKYCAHCDKVLPANEFYPNKRSKLGLSTYCKKCDAIYKKEMKLSDPTYISMAENRYCSEFLGCYVAENILRKEFDGAKLMPYAHPGYDIVCIQGKTIDCKSSTLQNIEGNSFWNFHIRKNKVPDYFLCIGFDNREDLNPMVCWLIPGNVVNDKVGLYIYKNKIYEWKQYERPLDGIIQSCNRMKQEVSNAVADTGC